MSRYLEPSLHSTNIIDAYSLNSTFLLHLFLACNEIIPIPLNNTFGLRPYGPLPDLAKPPWLQIYNFFWDVVFVGTVLLAGITGNVLSCFVLIRDRSHGTTSLILTALAICDTMFLVGCLFFQFLRTLSFFVLWIPYINLYAHTSNVLYGSGMAVRMMRNWMVVLVSLERWVAVCKPLHAPSICTRKKARIAIVIIALFSALYNVPHFFIVGAKPLLCTGIKVNQSDLIDTYTWNQTNLPVGTIIYHSALRQWVQDSYVFRLAYRLIGYTVIIVTLPNVIIGVLNVLLIRGIKYANARRAQIMARVDCANRQCSCNSLRVDHEGSSHLSPSCNTNPESHAYFVRVEKSTRSRTGEVNRLCVGVIVIYLVCELPAVGYQVIHLLQNRAAIDLTRPVTNALVCLNSGVNFFIYVFLGRRFRSQLKDLFRKLCSRCRPARDNNGHVIHSATYRSSFGPFTNKDGELCALNAVGSQAHSRDCHRNGRHKRSKLPSLGGNYSTQTSFTEV
ncbi:FMRFamide receptor [Fasciolopsis buskii]|uniref:FMRFamide receptor n=1 Tax=Fasciolopsis buskii TaxID=27845 RepID=A0A8E0S4A6_9TREM|nr:FMRFamide receptor [Fasciolopsis buski]